MKPKLGFSLIDVLLAVGVITVLAGLSLPALSRSFERTRAAGAKAALVESIATAINRAIIGDMRTVLCPSIDGRRCSLGYDWSQGWIGFRDENGDREREPSEPIFKRQGPLGGQVRLTSSEGRPRIVFQSSGSNAGSNVTFHLCDGRGPESAETLVMSNRGSIHLQSVAGTDGASICGP